MKDYQYKAVIESILNKPITGTQQASFYSIDERYRKHLVTLVAAGIPAMKAIRILKQAIASSDSLLVRNREYFIASIVDIVSKNYI